MSLMLNSDTKQHEAIKAVIYARVSSVKQKVSGDGLNSQVTRCEEYASYKGYKIAEVFKDDISGGVVDRPAMNAMLSFLRKQSNNSHVVIIDDISRLARGLEAHIKLRSDIADVGGILESPSIEFGEDSDSQLVENLLAVVSQHQRQKNGEQTKNRMRARTMNGYWVFAAPLGFRYERKPEHGKILVPHEPMASVIKEALEGFASGRFGSQAEVLHHFETLPYFPRDSRGYIRHQRIKDILTNPLYAGMISVPKWEISMRLGKHEGLITLEDFEKIQVRLKAKPVAAKRKDISADFILRGFVACGDCNSALTACWSKGYNKKYPYYLCHDKSCSSYGKSIRRDKLESEFEDVLQALQPCKGLMKTGADLFRGAWDQLAVHVAKQNQAYQKEIKTLGKTIDGFLDHIVETDSPNVIKAYETKITSLENKKLILAEKLNRDGQKRKPYDAAVRTAVEFLLNPSKLWFFGDMEEKRKVLKLAFKARLAYDREIGFRTVLPSLPFQVIQGLSSDMEGLSSSIGDMVRPRRLELPRVLPHSDLNAARLPIPPRPHDE